MQRKLIALGTCLVVLTLCWTPSGTARQKQIGPGKTGQIMKAKLKHSQLLLEGIALADYIKIARNAEDLYELSKAEEWYQIKTAKYEMFTNEFQRTTENIIAKAKAKNIDGVTLAYFEMTMSCVRCHSYMREIRDARLPADRGFVN